jgi:hypothetical protein
MTVVTTAVALVVGFLGGLLSFKVKRRWCARCGLTLTCPDGCSSVIDQGPRP